MDEKRQTGGADDRHNGTGLARAARYAGTAQVTTVGPDGDAVAPDNGAAWRPPAGGGGAHAAPEINGHAGGRPAPGLDDDTPPDGMPAVEPPVWREAARHAAVAPAEAPVWQAAAAPAVAAPESPAPRRPVPAPRTESDPSGAGPADRTWTDEGWAADARTDQTWPGAPVADETGPARPEPAWSEPTWAQPAAPVGGSDQPRPEQARAGGEELPQRVPAEPDVPDLGELAADAVPAEAPQLARIADQLRRDDVPGGPAHTEALDVDAVLDAVRGVAGVRAAALRTNATGAHTLRLDLADGADPVQVSRVVAQLLQERMGLSAAPRDVPDPAEGAARAPAGADPAAVAGEPAVTEVGRPGARSVGEPAVGPAVERWSPSLPAASPAPRVVIDQVQVNVEGLDATVEVRLVAGPRRALGLARGPAIDSYLVRLAAVSAAKAVDELMRDGQPPISEQSTSRCFVEHTGVVPFGATEVAVVVVLLVCGGWVEQLAGSAVVDGDARHAAVRATLGAVNRRLDALLAR